MQSLYESLKEYSKSDYYGFHMPGHKRNLSVMETDLPYDMDITEIEGFDDLHHPHGMIKELQQRAAALYHAQETALLINGSTAGILSAILGCTREGDKILVARNCHKSVYHAIFLNRLKPVYIYPEVNSDMEINEAVSPEKINKLLEENRDIKAVVITSPTYDGVISDIEAIAAAAHKRGIPLIVDEAHGAHFGFHPYFPKNALQKGADVVIHSLHKTLPTLTQTALLHKSGSLADWQRIRMYLDMLQTSSPSYVLMASVDVCVSALEKEGKDFFERYVKLLKDTREKLNNLKRLRVLEIGDYDFSKIVVSAGDTGYNGKLLYDILLKEYHLQMEMAAGSYVLGMTSVGDTAEGMERLVKALQEIDEKAERKSTADSTVDMEISLRTTQGKNAEKKGILPVLQAVYTSAQMRQLIDNAGEKERENFLLTKKWEDSVEYISTEYAYIYPPGIPLIVPGERISEEVVSKLCGYREMGFQIEGLRRENEIEVWQSE